jgi:hypothetical protein
MKLMKSRVTTLTLALLLGVSTVRAATSVTDTCYDDASATISGTWVTSNLNICEIIDDTGTISASVYIPAPLNAQLSTSTTSAPGILGSYSISNWGERPAATTLFTVSATAYGQTSAPGYTTVVIRVGTNQPVVIVGYGSVAGSLNQSFNVPAGTAITITVFSRINGSGFVTVSS